MENFLLLIFLLRIFLSLLMIFLQRVIRLSVGGRKLEGRKSSSGKSGVGSSSHPGYNVKNTTLRASLNKDVTSDNNQNAMRVPRANCDKVRKSNMSKESTAKTRDLTFKSGCGSKIIAAAKSAHLETAKSKVNKVVHSKATRLHRGNAQDSVTGATKANDKVGVNKYNRLGNGKENVTSQRPNTGAGGTVQQVQIVTKQKSIVPKVNKVMHSKATRLHRVNAQDSVTGATKANDKVGVNKYNRLGNGKENVTSQRPNTGAGAMVQQVQIVTKQKSIVPKTQDPEIAENRDTLVAPPRKSVVEPVDQWAFLDEIEAPMWVDLDLEAVSGYKDNDDNWFKISHLFHQSSSQQLISAFSCVGEGNTNKTSSPKLPRLVSKNYRIKDSGQSNCYGVASNKHHPIKNLISKSSGLNSSEKIKPKPSNGNRRGNARSKVNSVCSYPNPFPNFGNSKTGSSPAAIKEVESKSASTITSESGEEQHRKLLNVSSRKVSRTSGLLSSDMGSSNIKRRREKLLEEARESVPEPGSGRVMHLVKAFEKLLTIPKDSDQTDEKQSEDVGDDDDDKKGMKWALPGLQQPKVPETLISSSSFFPSDFFVTSESLALDSHVSSSLDGNHGSFTISNRTSGGGHRSRRNSSESSGTFGGSRWKKKQLKATYQKPFKLRTEQRGRYKEEEFVKKVQQMMMEEEKQRIPIAQGLPWTTDEPECLVKPAVKEIPRPVDLVLHSDVRAVKRAEFDQQLAKKMSVIEQYREKRERQQKLAEEEEIKRLRKELIPRAQLMPYFDRPFIPRRSMKHCTIPREPKFHIPPQHKKIKCGMC